MTKPAVLNRLRRPDKPPTKFTSDYKAGVYLVAEQQVHYWHDAGILPVPTCGGAKFVRTHAAQGGVMISWRVARLGAVPEMPSPEVDDKNLVFLGGGLTGQSPAVQIDGNTYVYAFSGVYYYQFREPEWVKDGLRLGVTAIDKTSPPSITLPAAKFKRKF